MPWFNKLPGVVRCAPGLEQRIWRRLPSVLGWGTVLPLGLAGAHRALAAPAADMAARGWWDDILIGVVTLHWSGVLTVGIGCFIVRVMKGPAYVADAYPLPECARPAAPDGRPVP